MKNLAFFLFLIFNSTYSQSFGCTDLLAKNYDQNALENNGSCQYENLKLRPKYSVKLSDSIKETSGLIVFKDLLWTHNDDHDKNIYGIDTLGKIQKKLFQTKL
ncbi:hypothetical protein ACQ9BO_23450 [Flavobacterium sp. P21]|uniref:hypothetical protein n=1 Tax=Flavobacterium sp. P21 TaxID=3423948 RepID=UPI003D672527